MSTSAVSSAGSAWLDDETLSAVRPKVRQLLERSQGFRALPADQQLDLARTMVRVAAFMANPHGLTRQELTPGKALLEHEPSKRQPPMAMAQADAVNTAKEKASEKVGTFAGADFQAGAVRQGVEQFKNLVG